MFIKIAIIVLITQYIDAKNVTCNDLLREFADVEGRFAHCVITKSVPVTMCTDCEEAFNSVKLAYNRFKNHTNCTSMYFDKDRLNLVASTEAALSGLWTKAYCEGM